MAERILVVEDDAAILLGLQDLLTAEGYGVDCARQGREALRLYAEQKPDLILLDIMIPELSGYEVCRQIRKQDTVTPILMLTAKGQEADKVAGLELGADDYVVKPFGVSELLARIRALLRRRADSCPAVQGGEPIRFGDVEISPGRLQGRRKDQSFSLTARELELIQLLYQHRGRVLSRRQILEQIWGLRYEGTTRTLDQHVATLRRKIEADPSDPRYILTVHRVGYRLETGTDLADKT